MTQTAHKPHPDWLSTVDPETMDNDDFESFLEVYEREDLEEIMGGSRADNSAAMDNHIRIGLFLEDRVGQIEAHAKRMVEEAQARANAYVQAETGKVIKGLDFHRGCLKRLISLTGKSTYNGVYGTARVSSEKPDVQMVDKKVDTVKKALAWLKKQGWAEAIGEKKEEIVKVDAVKAKWRETGEVPEGFQEVVSGGNVSLKKGKAA